MALAIGFAEQYYTLWDITEFTENVTPYVTRDVVRKTYKQNISKDINVVRAKYPNFDEIFSAELRGHSSFDVYGSCHDVNEDLFNYGKYEGEKIADCCDGRYMVWFYDQGAIDARKECLYKRLVELGYHFDGGVWRTEEEYTEYLNGESKFNQLVETLKNGEPFDVLMTSNLSLKWNDESARYDTADTVVVYENVDCFILAFKEFKVMQYNGYEYGVPVINGKGKRTKGKNVRITQYELDKYEYNRFGGYIEIRVSEFEILK